MEYINIRELVEKRATQSPDDVFMTFYGEHLTFKQFDQRVNRLANVFIKLGVNKGDRINIHLFNSPDHLVCCMAAFKIGAVACPINVQFTPGELVYQVNDSQGVVLVTENALAGVSAAVRDSFTDIRHIVELGASTGPGNLGFSELVGRESTDLAPVEILPDDNMVILYTSGTTGQPKGALLTHGNFIYMVKAVSRILTFPGREGKRNCRLIFMPMFHVNPLMHNLLALHRNDKIVLQRKFSVREFGPAVEKERPDYFFGVPKVYKVLLEARDTVKKYDLSSLRLGACGAAPIPPGNLTEFEREFGIEVIEGYGLTEATFTSTIHRPGGKKKAGSIGIALDGQEVRIMDPEGRLLREPGKIGEIVIKGPSLMKAYFRKEEETAKTLRDGWLHTGDIGRVDEDGFFYIVDREKDMIIKGGENIYPKEIEETVSEVNGVHDVAVVGVPDDISGEEVKAYVVPRIGSTLTVEQVIQHCKKRLAAFKVPRYVEFVLGLPASAIGKTLKRKLRNGEGVIRMDEKTAPIPLDVVWQTMAGRFNPQKAGKWQAKIAYEVFGTTSGAVTFFIKNGKIEIREGRHPEASAVVKMTDIALMRIIDGEMDILSGINSGLIQVEGSEADLTLFGEIMG
jgi:long-chain acyl-CoA synthetase